METVINAALLADATLQGLVANRIYPVILPEDPVFPAITYQCITTTPLYTLEERVQFTRYRLQIDAWALTYGATKAIASAVQAVMESLSDPSIDHAELDAANDEYESEARIYRVTMDFFVYSFS